MIKFLKMEENGITQKDITNKLMCDFEPGLINSIKSSFKDAMIDGCFHHYIKLLWGYAKKLGLFKQKDIKNTKLFIFISKFLPYLRQRNKKIIFQKKLVIFIIGNINEGYHKFIKYYKDNWLSNKLYKLFGY